MHFEAGDSNEETWARELLLLVVFAKDVAHILAEKAFDCTCETPGRGRHRAGRFSIPLLLRGSKGGILRLTR